jgi:hypothetical protein
MDVLGRRLAKEYPNEDPGQGISVRRTVDVRFHPQFDTLLTALATLLLGAVSLVLAIACSNLATHSCWCAQPPCRRAGRPRWTR